FHKRSLREGFSHALQLLEIVRLKSGPAESRSNPFRHTWSTPSTLPWASNTGPEISFWIVRGSGCSLCCVSFTVSKILACFTRGKLLNSSSFLLIAVCAAIADEPESGIAPAVLSSSGNRNFSMPPSSRSSATSLERTRKVLESSAQNSEGVASIRGRLSCVEFSTAVVAAATELSCPELRFIPCIRLHNCYLRQRIPC